MGFTGNMNSTIKLELLNSPMIITSSIPSSLNANDLSYNWNIPFDDIYLSNYNGSGFKFKVTDLSGIASPSLSYTGTSTFSFIRPS